MAINYEVKNKLPLLEEWVTSSCVGCMQSDCSIKVEVKDGVVTNIEGNPDKAPPAYGRVCSKSIASIMTLYNPYRIKSPLKRTNPQKGVDIDPVFVEISWEEAISTVVERFKKIRTDDPRKLGIWWGWGFTQTLMMGTPYIGKDGIPTPASVYPAAFGTPNELNSRCLCAIHYASNLVHGHQPEAISDLQYCKYLIAPGRTVGANTGTAHGTSRLIDAIDRGMKLVVIDPRFSPEASKAYRWVPVRPGTELAFTLAMIYGIFYEVNKFDEWFVKNRTNGPYLIGADGLYIRDKASNKPLIWDIKDDQAKTFDDPSIKEYALFGEYNVNGVTIHPGLHLIKERMKEYTPEWAEKITTIPATIIRDITREFVEYASIGSTINIDGYEFPFRPAQIAGSGRGAVSQRNGTLFDLATKIINLLVGAMEVPGGITGNSAPGPGPWILQPDVDGTVTPINEAIGLDFKFPPDHLSMNEFYPHAHATPYVTARAILNPEKYYLDYNFEAMLNCGANSMRSGCDRDLLIKAFQKVPFIVTFGMNYDEVTLLSDIVFPDHHFLEQTFARINGVSHQSLDDSIRGLKCVVGRNPAVKPLYNTRLGDDILLEIADRVGFLKGSEGLNDLFNRAFRFRGQNVLDLDKCYSIQEIVDRVVKQIFGDDKGFRTLLEKGVHYQFDPQGKEAYNYYYWPSNKTRHPIYFERLLKSGRKMNVNLVNHNIEIPNWKDKDEYLQFFHAIPYWITPPEMEPSEFDLYACNWKTSLMRHGTNNTQENAWLAEMRDNDPYELFIWINGQTAGDKGLQNKDEVCVESKYGKVTGVLKVTELIHPEVLGISGCYGSGTFKMSPDSRKGTHFNLLISGEESSCIDPISGSITISPKVKIYKSQPRGRRK